MEIRGFEEGEEKDEHSRSEQDEHRVHGELRGPQRKNFRQGKHKTKAKTTDLSNISCVRYFCDSQPVP
jgi:hypothetical protein